MGSSVALAKSDREEVREFVRIVTDQHGDALDEIILFGSGGRGSLSEDSDLDVLIVLKRRSLPVSKEITRIATDMLLRYGRYLSVKILPEAVYRQLQALQPPFMVHLARDGKVLWKRE